MRGKVVRILVWCRWGRWGRGRSGAGNRVLCACLRVFMWEYARVCVCVLGGGGGGTVLRDSHSVQSHVSEVGTAASFAQAMWNDLRERPSRDQQCMLPRSCRSCGRSSLFVLAK